MLDESVYVAAFNGCLFLELLFLDEREELVPEEGEFLVEMRHVVDILHVAFVDLRHESVLLDVFVGVLE